MITVVVYEEKTRKVLAAIPMKDDEAALCKDGIEFQIFNDTEPVFTETKEGVILSDNKIIINLQEGKENED